MSGGLVGRVAEYDADQLRLRYPPRRELLCQKCGHEYQVWSAPNDLWNRVAAGWHFLCFDCFIDIYRKDTP